MTTVLLLKPMNTQKIFILYSKHLFARNRHVCAAKQPYLYQQNSRLRMLSPKWDVSLTRLIGTKDAVSEQTVRWNQISWLLSGRNNLSRRLQEAPSIKVGSTRWAQRGCSFQRGWEVQLGSDHFTEESTCLSVKSIISGEHREPSLN